MNINRNKIIKLVVAIVLLLAALLLFFWAWGKGRIKITLPNDGSKVVEIIGSNTNVNENTEKNSFSKILDSGTYSVVIVKDDISYVELVKVGGLFSNTSVDASNLQEQSGREFIGDEPRSCPVLVGSELVSYSCGGILDSLVYHNPAGKLPTYTTKVEDSAAFSETITIDPETIEGTATINNTVYLLRHPISGDELDNSSHSLYKIEKSGDSMRLKFDKKLSILDDEESYKLRQNNGILYISGSDGRVFSGTSFENLKDITPKNLEIDENSELVAGKDDQVLVISFAPKSSSQKQIRYTDTLVSIVEKDKSLQKTFKGKILSEIEFCGEYICALDGNKTLLILDRSLEVVRSVEKINTYSSIGGELYAQSDTKLIRLNLQEFKGKIDFLSDYFTISNLTSTNNRMILTLRSANKNHAVVLTDNSSKPDELFIPLFKNGFVKTVSIYKKTAFVSPELGDEVYNSSTCTYEYREDIKVEARDTINNLLNNSGVVNSGYNTTVNLVNTPPSTVSLCAPSNRPSQLFNE